MTNPMETFRARAASARWERRTDRPLLVLALAFVVVLLLPMLADLTSTQATTLSAVSALIWAVFAVDYAARLYLAPRRGHFIRTHPLDLVVIALPMLRPLRALRVLRLLRVGTLLGFTHHRAHRSLHSRVTGYVSAAVLVVIGVSAVAMLDVEKDSPDANITDLGDALWWASTTVTTVGYGDRYPTTTLGRAIAVSLMVVGIALLGVITATVAAFFVSRLQDVQEAEERTEATLADVLDELREVRARLDALTAPPASS